MLVHPSLLATLQSHATKDTPSLAYLPDTTTELLISAYGHGERPLCDLVGAAAEILGHRPNILINGVRVSELSDSGVRQQGRMDGCIEMALVESLV